MVAPIAPWVTLADPETGRLGRPSIADDIPVPTRIEADESGIIFDFSWVRPEHPPRDLLDRFINAKTDSALIKFAKRFGPLALFHSGEGDVPWPDPQQLADLCDDPHRETLADWRRCQRQMRLVLALMGTLHDNDTPTVDALADFNDAVGGAFVQSNVLDKAKTNSDWRKGLAMRAGLFYAKTLAQVCRLTPVVRMNRKGRMEIVFQDAVGHVPGGGLSLAGALTVQLMSAFAGTALAVCSSCGHPYFPDRRPARGRNKYCTVCGTRASWRDSKRKQRGTK
jgi:hypothetical protein